MRKAVKVLVCLSAWLVFSGCGYALELSDTVEEWHCVKEYIVPLILDAGSEDLGRMVYRDYVRDFPKGTVQIIMTEGRGTGSLYVPESVRNSEGAMSADSGYKIVDIDGRKSILESHKYMPVSLAVNAAENTVITIESSSLTEEEIIDFAKNILR